MTTVTFTKDKTTNVVVQAQQGGNNIRVYTGEVVYRSTSGGDRVIGSIPKPKAIPVFYNTKPRLKAFWTKTYVNFTDSRGKTRRRVKWVRSVRAVTGSSQKVRYVWKREPVRFTYEVEHSYSGWRHAFNGTTVAVNVNGTPTGWGTRDPLQWQFQPADPWSTSDGLAALGKLREAIAGSDFNLAVALGEAPKALKMVGDTTSRLFLAYRAVKRGNFSQAVRTLRAANLDRGRHMPKPANAPVKRDAAGNWLALQYGWKPLLQDIHGGMVFVDHQLRNPTVKTYRVRRYAGGSKSRKHNLPHTIVDTWCPGSLVSSQDIVARIKEKNVARLSGLMDPASVAWELLPYSFVVDWFIPIGNYLSARGLADSVTGTFITTNRLRFKGVGASSSKPIHTKYHGRSNTIIITKVTRTVSTTLSVPKPSIKPLAKAASWQHAVNAVALFVARR